jgi:integrase
MNVEGCPQSEWFSPHGLRRACATHNYERGVDLVAIQQLLGHWTVASTMRYLNQGSGIAPDGRETAGRLIRGALQRRSVAAT